MTNATGRGTQPLRVLVVDDDLRVVRAMARALRGHQAELCVGGQEAVATLERDPGFDVILCDLNMPGVDGIEVYRAAVQRDPELARRFVFLTGGAYTERACAFLEEHRPRLLEKSCEPSVLIEQLERIASARSSPGGDRSQ